MQKANYRLAVVIIGMGILVIVGLISRNSPTDIDAWQMAKQFVSQNLKAPSTAIFPHSSECIIQKLPDRRFRVAGYVDSQNGFGAIMRSDWVCTVRYQSGNVWTLEGLAIGGEVLKAEEGSASAQAPQQNTVTWEEHNSPGATVPAVPSTPPPVPVVPIRPAQQFDSGAKTGKGASAPASPSPSDHTPVRGFGNRTF